ncbi:helix-turn-helix domain-containing protein [Streptomyces sp. YIM S03343]
MPSVGRRLVGELLRVHRTRLGLTQKEAAELLHVSESCFGAYERAERIPTTEFLKHGDKGLDARGALCACVEMMDVERYPPRIVDWVRAERLAHVIRNYETMLVPGLLQTEGYAHALYGARVPAFTSDEIQQHVEARLERQSVLTRQPPPLLGFVIEESVLERPIGGPDVLRQQLHHLLHCMKELNHLTLQVMPTGRHVHAGLRGPLQLMSTAEGQNLAYTEGHGGSTVVSKAEQVNRLSHLFGVLQAQALTPWESAELIERKAEAL